MPNEHWDNLDKRDVPDQEVAERFQTDAEPDWSDPFATAATFLQALADPQHYQVALLNLIHPYTAASWGDFSEAAAGLASIQNWGLGNKPSRAEGRPDVAYAAILRNVDQTFQSQSDQVVMTAAVITLVWSAERQMWLVYSIGDYTGPEDIAPLA
ncbi:hypothetical protein [Leifsonia sp. 22587]|uniref:hypothetical protein n=1 Tax=Leifsonia sp. 22587 TaxID=3453946 RepID=UPI003F856D3D